MAASTIENTLRTFFEESQYPVLFVGAGVSAHAGLPSWANLIDKLAAFMQGHDPLITQIMREASRKKDFTRAFDFFELSDVVEGEKRRALKSLLSKYDAAPLVGISKLPFNTFLTTNFDRSLHDAIAKSRGASPKDYRYGDASFREAVWDNSLLIARIHGAIENPASVVLSGAKFKDLLDDETYKALLMHCFAQRNVLFVGFSFYDPAIRHVFEELERIHGPGTPGRHLALLPGNADADFLGKASRLNIKVVTYDASDQHRALWDAIDSYHPAAKASLPKRPEPLSSTKRYLAACYARAKTTGHARALRESVMEAIVAAILQEVRPGSLNRADLLERVRAAIGLKKKDSEDLVERSLMTLEDAGLVRRMKGNRVTNYAWNDQSETQDSLASDIEYLCESIEARAKVQEGWAIVETTRIRLPDIFSHLIRNRGWDLGAAFASGRPPEPVEMASLLSTPNLNLPAFDQERLARIFSAMLQDPTEREAKLLADMGRTAFAIELAFQTPRSVLLHEAILPQRIYLDASVLLPAIVPGHPFAETYAGAIRRLREAASAAAVDLRIKVSTPYLNEIISHRRKAEYFAEESGPRVAELATRDARYNGAENTNVYIGAFASWISKNGPISFEDFMRRNAPYTSEKELKKFLEKRGYEIVNPQRTQRYSEIYRKLEKDYASVLARWKTPILIEHDALQLALLQDDLLQGHRAILVSADRQLRQFVGNSLEPALADAMVSHVGIIQFIELMLGEVPEGAGFTQLLWSARQSDQRANIRAYYVGLALSAYDAALLMAMPEIVDDLVNEADRGIARNNESLETSDPRAKARAFMTLASFEENYFQKMDAAIKKIERDLHD